jgi:NAD(P)-dependent dehydrogenase (short-subunit alcohol dehydrogenase family)
LKTASFFTEVKKEDIFAFAKISGDWNPLHTNEKYAQNTSYKRLVLHGAYSAGLVSKVAGEYLPGEECLLNGINLRFVAPIFPPVELEVNAKEVLKTDSYGKVDVVILDRKSRKKYVEASYEYGFHSKKVSESESAPRERIGSNSQSKIIITGASGGLGGTLLKEFGNQAIGVSRSKRQNTIQIEDFSHLERYFNDIDIEAIVHCAWPDLDNQKLLDLENSRKSIEYYLSESVDQIVNWAKLLRNQGKINAPLILVGSTASEPGRHAYKSPLYSLSKSLIPSLTRILSLELASSGHRCFTVTFDALDGGMNAGLSSMAKIALGDRTPFGEISSLDDACEQIIWTLNNRSKLATGAVFNLTGGAIP